VHAVLITTNTEVGVKEHQKKRDNTTSTYQVYKDGIHPGDLLAKAWLCKIEEQSKRDCWTIKQKPTEDK